MKISHKEFVKIENRVYGKWDETLRCNHFYPNGEFFVPYSSLAIKYAIRFTEDETIIGYHGRVKIEDLLMDYWNQYPLIEYHIFKIKWSIRNPREIIFIIHVERSEADC